MINTSTLEREQIQTLPLIQVLRSDNQVDYFRTQSFEFNEITFENTKNDRDEFVIPLKKFSKKCVPDGVIMNFREYLFNLKEAILNQEVVDYQSNRW